MRWINNRAKDHTTVKSPLLLSKIYEKQESTIQIQNNKHVGLCVIPLCSA